MLVTLPILLPLGASALCLALWGRARVHQAIAIATAAAMVAVAIALLAAAWNHGTQTAALGGWAAPYGIALVADLLGAILVLLTAICGLAIAIFSIRGTTPARAANGHAPLSLAMLGAISGAFLSGDLFNIYVWFELMLLSSFVLLTLGGERAQLEGVLNYCPHRPRQVDPG